MSASNATYCNETIYNAKPNEFQNKPNQPFVCLQQIEHYLLTPLAEHNLKV